MIRIFLFLGCIASLYSCTSFQRNKTEDSSPEESYGFFSIKNYALDQYKFYRNQPITFLKITHWQNKADSNYANIPDIAWGALLDAFLSSDISGPEHLDAYNFSSFLENSSDQIVYFYEAKSPDSYTQVLQVHTDPLSSKITKIFITTQSELKRQQLSYIPWKLIQVQEFKESLTGEKMNLKVEYRFL